MTYPKRLIEVDLPIKRISAHARREKSIRHGHISTLHIWWARRPLASCRAVICAALWPDPADPLCPQAFREAAAREMITFAKATQQDSGLADICDKDSWSRYGALAKRKGPFDLKTLPAPMADVGGKHKGAEPTDLERLRGLLLDFIADFAAWKASTEKTFLKTARALTQAAHEALGGVPGTRPLVVDPFAGGGSIPLEALRVGADTFASDLNPVAVLLNKVVLEYIPKYGQRLADEVRKWGQWVKEQAEKELAEFYPKDPDGATPIAYLWARTIKCEGPGCGAEVPLMRSLWLAKKANRSVALRLVPRPRANRVDFQIITKERDCWVDQDDPKTRIGDPKLEGTVKRGSVTCPCCGYTTPVVRVREQLKERHGGTGDARMVCVVCTKPNKTGRLYRCPRPYDLEGSDNASLELQRRKRAAKDKEPSLIPNEKFSGLEPRRIPLPQYGISGFEDLFSPRAALVLSTLSRNAKEAADKVKNLESFGFAGAIATCLAFAVDRIADQLSCLVIWASSIEVVTHTFGRQALPMTWDFVEPQPFAGAGGDFGGAVEWVSKVCEMEGNSGLRQATVVLQSADKHSMPNGSSDAFITDPPYYYSVPYADLSDFFYVWLRRTCGDLHPELFGLPVTDKDNEIIQNLPHSQVAHLQKDRSYYESGMLRAFQEARRINKPGGIGVIVFAHTETAAWEAMLNATISAGWMITGSWPIDTEREARVIAQRQSTLASSVHLVCRPRENPDGSLRADTGDWRDVLTELPKRIHEWLPRLAEEGVVGADAIFACLGPALEVFSRYSRVEKASGEQVTLREYLEQVWAAVSKEALNMIFAGADATGFEEDARLTAMWLWTLAAPNGQESAGDEDAETESDEEGGSGKKAAGGYSLEYDAARKIAQGLGAHLEKLAGMVEVKGDTARLLSVAERTRALFGKDQADAPSSKRKKKDTQMKLGFEAELEAAEAASGGWGEKSVSKVGATVLDRLHQTMILFASGRSEAMRRFLVDDGIGRDQRFWRLAQALSALYPANTDEKRWVDGVLARKKGLGF
jgi:adenine-specific DNA methylase